jgi:hypothetical protein
MYFADSMIYLLYQTSIYKSGENSMNKTLQRNYSETLVRFLDESEEKNPLKMADLLSDLHRCESSLHRYAVIACERELTDSENKRQNTVTRKVDHIAAVLGFPVRYNNDPRGFAIQFVLPSGRSNSFGGEIWGLNW